MSRYDQRRLTFDDVDLIHRAAILIDSRLSADFGAVAPTKSALQLREVARLVNEALELPMERQERALRRVLRPDDARKLHAVAAYWRATEGWASTQAERASARARAEAYSSLARRLEALAAP